MIKIVFVVGEIYTQTIISGQKYCKKCLSCYLTNITDNNMYLDVYLFTKDLENMKQIYQKYHKIFKNAVEIV
jgi:hypothetical protein